VVVIFGGGTPSCGFAANVQMDTAGSLGLNNGDTITIADSSSTVLISLVYPSAVVPQVPIDTSVTLNPDLAGVYQPHNATAPGLLFSPGQAR